MGAPLPDSILPGSQPQPQCVARRGQRPRPSPGQGAPARVSATAPVRRETGAETQAFFWPGSTCQGLSHNPRPLRDGGRDPGLLLALEHLSRLVGEYQSGLAGWLGVKSWCSPFPASQKLSAGQAGWVEWQDMGRVQTPIEVALGGSASSGPNPDGVSAKTPVRRETGAETQAFSWPRSTYRGLSHNPRPSRDGG